VWYIMELCVWYIMELCMCVVYNGIVFVCVFGVCVWYIIELCVCVVYNGIVCVCVWCVCVVYNGMVSFNSNPPIFPPLLFQIHDLFLIVNCCMYICTRVHVCVPLSQAAYCYSYVCMWA
jgi:hypothetical protein